MKYFSISKLLHARPLALRFKCNLSKPAEATGAGAVNLHFFFDWENDDVQFEIV